MENVINKVFIILFFTGCIGIIFWLFVSTFIAKKWMNQVAEILEDGHTIFTVGIVFGLQGTLQYASVFFWTFHAKRCDMLKRRKLVPKHIQAWYIFSYCLFMVSVLVFSISILLFFYF